MGLFAPRTRCPHCGKKVKQPRDADDFLCPHCGKPGPWASLAQASSWQGAEVERGRRERIQTEARERYAAVLAALSTGALTDTTALPTLMAETGFTPEELGAKQSEAFGAYIREAAGDDILTPDEETHVQELVHAFGIDLGAFLRASPELGRHVMIAEANGGFLPEVSSSRLIQKKGEVVHLEVAATLLKDVTVRESQGGYSGFSFPIGKTGIRYRVGGYKGQSVDVGTRRVPADDGVLVVSSQRAVFLGAKKTMELPFAKLVSLTLFSDAVQFHESNRQAAPVFLVLSSDVVAAFVHAAVQRLNV